MRGITKLLDGALTDTTTDSALTTPYTNRTGIVQVAIAGSASVVIEGRLSPLAPWVAITDSAVTASSAFEIILMRELRVVATGVGGGAVDVWLQA